MSRVRFNGTSSANIPVPPEGKASLYYDDTDKSLKMKLDTGDILALGVTEEYIQDLVGGMVNNSNSIDVIYNDDNDVISLSLKPKIIDDDYVDKISPVYILDNQNGRFQGNIITNDSFPSTICSLDCAVDGSWMVELRITAKRIGGMAGNVGDGATFKRTFRIKSIGSSVTVHDYQSDYTSRDNPVANVLVSVNSTNVLVNVCGVDDNNIKWNADVITSVNV